MWRFLTRRPLILLVVAALLTLVTTHKLFRMCQIKGWLPGASVHQQRVTDLWHEIRETSRGTRHTYWVGWGVGPTQQPGPHRLNLPFAAWSALHTGDLIEIIWLPFDHLPYTRDDIFVQPGQFAFDGVLLVLELTGLIYATRLIRGSSRPVIAAPDSPIGPA